MLPGGSPFGGDRPPVVVFEHEQPTHGQFIYLERLEARLLYRDAADAELIILDKEAKDAGTLPPAFLKR